MHNSVSYLAQFGWNPLMLCFKVFNHSHVPVQWYPGRTGSVMLLMHVMPWLIVSPGHQQSWYWLHRIQVPRLSWRRVSMPHFSDVIMGGMASQITGISIVYSIVCSGADERMWPVNSPHKGPVTRKMFPFDDVIMMCRLFRALILDMRMLNLCFLKIST